MKLITISSIVIYLVIGNNLFIYLLNNLFSLVVLSKNLISSHLIAEMKKLLYKIHINFQICMKSKEMN